MFRTVVQLSCKDCHNDFVWRLRTCPVRMEAGGGRFRFHLNRSCSSVAAAVALAVVQMQAHVAMAQTGNTQTGPAAQNPAIEVPGRLLTAYDAGYAFRASKTCPGVRALVPLERLAAEADFKRGEAIFDKYVDVMQLEGACGAALNLYDSRAGKVLPLLEQTR